MLLSAVRPLRTPPLCPLNWALAVFFLQLVVVPLLVCTLGPERGVLPALPSSTAMNVALLLSSGAFWAFAMGLQMAERYRPNVVQSNAPVPLPVSRGVAIAFVGIGIVGTLVAFGGTGSLGGYFSHSTPALAALAQATDSITNTIGVICRSFLGFGFLVFWCVWIVRRRHSRLAIFLGTALTAFLVFLSYSTFSYNRGAFVAPLLSLLALYGARVRPLSARTIVVFAVLGLFLLAGFRLFRTDNASLEEGLTSQRETLVAKINLNKELQVYAAGPQYVGFLLEQTQYADKPSYGRGLFGSLMYPVPGLGRPFRAASDVTIYNRLIYGPTVGFKDQVVPFQGELYINFGLPGLIVGFLLLGGIISRVQRRFLVADSELETYCWQYAATWLAYLVVGSLAVVSQIFVYFFWPVYALAVWRWMSGTAAHTRRSRV